MIKIRYYYCCILKLDEGFRMLLDRILGYLYLTLGLFCLIFFIGKFFFQILFLIVGFSLVVKGLRLLAFDRAAYHYYSQNYFNDQFKR